MLERIDSPPATPAPGGPARPHGRRARLRRATWFIAGVLAAFLAVGAYANLNPGPRPLTSGDVASQIAEVLASQTPGPPTAELVYDAVQPSIVVIETDGVDASGGPTGGLGSGVVVNTSGSILTALHVVAGATSIQVTFADGSTSPATVASTQPANDIAVLQPATVPASVTPATLGNPRSMAVGSDAYIVGNPFGLNGSLSAGVVSGLDRSYRVPQSSTVFTGLIQVDAAVNPGNSGGPLLNRGGQVVGIVTALVNPTQEDVFIGIGFAVPIDVAGGAAGLPPD